MSTILDSLKKSSDKRDTNDKDTLNNFNFGNDKKPPKMMYMLFVVILIVLILAALYWGYTSLYKSEVIASDVTKKAIQNSSEETKNDTNTINQQTKSNPTVRKKPDNREVKNELAKSEQSRREKDRKRQEIRRKLGENKNKEAISEEGLLKLTMPGKDNKVELDSKETKSTPKKEKPEVAKQDYLYAYQLPFRIRKDIPKLILNIHVYDDNPENRIAIINGEKFVIDDMIDDLVLIKDINKEGVVLEFNETEFLVPR